MDGIGPPWGQFGAKLGRMSPRTTQLHPRAKAKSLAIPSITELCITLHNEHMRFGKAEATSSILVVGSIRNIDAPRVWGIFYLYIGCYKHTLGDNLGTAGAFFLLGGMFGLRKDAVHHVGGGPVSALECLGVYVHSGGGFSMS